MITSRFQMNSVGLSRALAASGRLRRVLPDWSFAPVQIHAITDTRLLPARTRLFIDFIKERLN